MLRPPHALLPAPLAIGLVLAGSHALPLQGSGKPGAMAGLEGKAGAPETKAERKEAKGGSGKAARRAEHLRLRFEAGADLRDQDLASLDLRGRNLSGRDLRGWRLAGKDLTGADLSFCNLTGVSLEGCRLFGTNTLGAVGLGDLSGAVVHPFFRAKADAALGQLEYLSFLEDMETEADRKGTLRDLVVGPDHRLLFIPASGREHLTYFADGSKARGTTQLGGKDGTPKLACLAVDRHGQTWIAHTEGTVTVLDRRGLALRGGGRITGGGSTRPNRMTATADGCMCISLPDSNHVLALEKGKAKSGLWELKSRSGAAYQAGLQVVAVPGRSGRFTVLYDQGDGQLAIRHVDQSLGSVPLPAETVCVDLAQGEGEAILFAASGPGGHHVGRIVPGKDGKGTLETIVVAAAGADRGLRGVAQGPGGRVWYADQGGQIGYVNFETRTDRQEWRLPGDDRPVRLVPFGTDRMAFAVEGRCRIGTIQALEAGSRGDTKAADPDRGFGAALYKPRPVEPKRVTAVDRRERAVAMVLRAAEAASAGAGEVPAAAAEGSGALAAAEPGTPGAGAGVPEGAGPAKDSTSAGAGPARKATPAGAGTAPARAARTPEQRLAHLGIVLPAGPLEHILRAHGENVDPARSQFRTAHSTAEGVTRLLADGLESCGAIARVRSWTLDGRWLTPCRMATEVGWFNLTRTKAETAGKWVATDLFVVVTEGSPDGTQTIVTAYPEHPRGI